MNERSKELAEKAGFVLWGNESWGPGEGHVDWSCDYEDVLVKYTELIVKECASELIRWKDEPFPYDPEFGAKLIKQHFGVK
jgi:hypothetical protein